MKTYYLKDNNGVFRVTIDKNDNILYENEKFNWLKPSFSSKDEILKKWGKRITKKQYYLEKI